MKVMKKLLMIVLLTSINLILTYIFCRLGKDNIAMITIMLAMFSPGMACAISDAIMADDEEA